MHNYGNIYHFSDVRIISPSEERDDAQSLYNHSPEGRSRYSYQVVHVASELTRRCLPCQHLLRIGPFMSSAAARLVFAHAGAAWQRTDAQRRCWRGQAAVYLRLTGAGSDLVSLKAWQNQPRWVAASARCVALRCDSSPSYLFRSWLSLSFA